MATDPSQPSLRERAHGLKDAHLTCRTIGHAWKPQTAAWHAESAAYYAAYGCTRCRTERRCWYDRHGHPVSTSYAYPEGYAMTGLGHLDADDRGTIRVEAFTRMLGAPSANLKAI